MGCGVVPGNVLCSCRLLFFSKSALLYCQIGKCVQLSVCSVCADYSMELEHSCSQLTGLTQLVLPWVQKCGLPSYTIGYVL